MAQVWTVTDEGLANSSYVAQVADGVAVAVDPGRDPRPYLDLAAAHGLRIGFVAETHVHADFVSGGRELAGLGAQLLAPVGSGLAFGHEELRDGQEMDLGGLILRAVATPGHTPEHMSYLLLDGSEPRAVFTGGALIPGGVARTDLSGQAESATRAAYRSARVLLAMPDTLAIYPTHGPGSFCSSGVAGQRHATIGREKAASPLLAMDEHAFADALLAGLGSYPAYFGWMPAVNRRGAPRYGINRPPLAGLTPAHVAELAMKGAGGATIVDTRPVGAFATAHVPGSLSIALRPAFATWLGWLADPQRPLIVVLDDGQSRGLVVEACLKVGFDNLAGELDGGIRAWRAAGLATASIPLVEATEAATDDGRRGGGPAQVVDVRQDAEWAAGHVPGAAHRELGTLAWPGGAAGLADEPVTVMCEHGERAMTGASLLAAGGAKAVSVVRGGPGDWAKATGESMEYG
jgi:glyoxylase-like metal-dependent hydrolase (beta-lactamase superfamily II)/rhodanese-related sulfurtransferase